MCFTVQLSRLSVLRQLCYFIMLFSACQELFSSFFKLYFQHSFFPTAFRVYHNPFALSRFFFAFFFKKERRRRDLNPRAAINDLLPFQGSPFGQLGYFSKLSQIRYLFLITLFTLSCSLFILASHSKSLVYYILSLRCLSSTFLSFFKNFFQLPD